MLDLGDITLVAWLCAQVEPSALLGSSPPLLSQQVMLVLLQQLSFDLSQVSRGLLKLACMPDCTAHQDTGNPSLKSVEKASLGLE